MDEGCKRIGKESGIGGPLMLLSVWMWERFSIGRAKVCNYKLWDDHGHPLRRPTWAYKWDVVAEVTGDPNLMYRTYINEFDALTPEQVIFIFVSLQFLFGLEIGNKNPMC